MHFTTVVLDQPAIFGSESGKAKLCVSEECLSSTSQGKNFETSIVVVSNQRLQNPKIVTVEYAWEYLPSMLFAP